MTARSDYAQWLDRGRAHQSKGRLIDAMLCFKRAAAALPHASDPFVLVGEVFWQLGRPQDAVAAWRQAEVIAPGHLAPHLALAEALLATGDVAGAHASASRALALEKGAARTELVAAAAGLALANAGSDAVARERALEAAATAIAREPMLIQVPTIMTPLAFALDHVPAGKGRSILLDAVIAAAADPPGIAALPAQLLVHALAHAGLSAGAIVAAVRDRNYLPEEHDALRRIALTTMSTDRIAAAKLGALYAMLCAHCFHSDVPLLWPQRTAGSRLRIIALLAAGTVDPAALAAVRALMREPPARFDIAVAVIGGNGLPEPLAGRDNAPARVAALPWQPDAATAKALATFDADLIVDLAGLTASAGLLLAARPARAALTLASLAVANAPPLVDEVVDDASALLRWLAVAEAAMGTVPTCALDAATLNGLWEGAVRAHGRGERDRALAAYASITAHVPGHAPSHYLAGVARRDIGDLDAARVEFAAALDSAPNYVEARVAAAVAATAQGDHDGAIELCRDGVERAPLYAPLWRTLGLAELARRNGVAAGAALQQALSLDPTDGETHYNHGVSLQMQHALPEAARAYQRALAMKPELVTADFNLGVIFQEQGATDAAITAYQNVLARAPKHVGAYKNLGEALLAAGRMDAWIANFHRFEANCPRSLSLAAQALEACQYNADFQRLDEYLDGLRDGRFEASDATELVDALEQILYLLLFFDVEPELIHRLALTYSSAAPVVYGAPLSRSPTRAPGKLRIGYLSADLRNHVMGKMMWQALRHHDRERFAIYVYSLSSAQDDWTGRFADLAHCFEVLADLGEREAAQRIAAADLDILVDLCGHTKGGKPGILAIKPARVQLTHVASAGSVGLDTVDFKLTDRYADLATSQQWMIETLLPMDGCVYPYRHVEAAAEHPFHRATLGIAHDAVVIGAFVTPMKLSRRCLALWRDVLARLPRARLAFSPTHPTLRPVFERLCESAQIARERLLFFPQGRDDAENQARYALIDFVLDPMPFGGVNGVLEPLDAGVPVVALLGKRHGERSAYTILANLGVTSTLAHGGPEYIDIAVRLADDSAFMDEVRAAIRAGLKASTLVDMPAHARNLEGAYLEALRAKIPEVLPEARGG